MCVDPASLTLATVSTYASIGGTALSVVNAISNASAQSAQANYQAELARRNQMLANQAAAEAEAAGRQKEQQSRLATQKLQGRQRAVLAGNGVLVDSGSALDITEGTADLGELDALTIRSNAEREAIGYRNQGINFGGEADLARARAANVLSSGYASAGGQLLTGAGSVAARWYNYKKEGL